MPTLPDTAVLIFQRFKTKFKTKLSNIGNIKEKNLVVGFIL